MKENYKVNSLGTRYNHKTTAITNYLTKIIVYLRTIKKPVTKMNIRLEVPGNSMSINNALLWLVSNKILLKKRDTKSRCLKVYSINPKWEKLKNGV